MALSDNGRFVVWASRDPAFGATSFNGQLVRRDVEAGFATTALINGGLLQQQGLSFPRVSGDGDVVVFAVAEALVAGDVNNGLDVFAYRFSDAAVVRLSPSQAFQPAVSTDGSRVVFIVEFDSGPDDVDGVPSLYVVDDPFGTPTTTVVQSLTASGTFFELPHFGADGTVVIIKSVRPLTLGAPDDGEFHAYAVDIREPLAPGFTFLGLEPPSVGPTALTGFLPARLFVADFVVGGVFRIDL